jgi:hypothetical protein
MDMSSHLQEMRFTVEHLLDGLWKDRAADWAGHADAEV